LAIALSSSEVQPDSEARETHALIAATSRAGRMTPTRRMGDLPLAELEPKASV
jgi:hypothetical protein